MATHSGVLAWRIPGTGEPGGLPSMGPPWVGHDWSDLAAAAAAGKLANIFHHFNGLKSKHKVLHKCNTFQHVINSASILTKMFTKLTTDEYLINISIFAWVYICAYLYLCIYIDRCRYLHVYLNLETSIMVKTINSPIKVEEKWSEVAQSCPTLSNPMDGSLPGPSIHGIFQARILECVAISFSRRSSQPRGWTQVSCFVGRHFTVWATREVQTIG